MFDSLHTIISDRLHQEPSEWRHSYGRPPKNVYIDAQFIKFTPQYLNEPELKLLGKPLLHTYWTDCTVSIPRFCAFVTKKAC